MFTDRELKEISELVYNVDAKESDGRILKDDFILNGEFKVIAVEDNQNNGMQSMAVIKTTLPDQILIAYAGTNLSDINDINTDVQLIIGGNKESLTTGLKTEITKGSKKPISIIPVETHSQFKTAQGFYEKIKKDYPQKDIEITGHSLGGYLALVIGAENQVKATAFNSPNPRSGLSEKAICWIKSNRNMYRNYRIKYDIIANTRDYIKNHIKPDTLGISIWITVEKETLNPIFYHDLKAYNFDKEGKILIDEE